MTDLLAPALVHRAHPDGDAYVGAPVRRREEREAELAVVARARRHPPGRRRGAPPRRGARRRSGCASSATSTASSTRARGGAWRASARCSSPPRTTTSAPGSPTRSRSPRWPPASPGPPTSACRWWRPSPSPTTAATGRRATPPRRRSRRSCPARATTTPSTAPTSPWRRSTSASRRSTACATTRGAARRPSTPEGEVVAWADRIAYVCHDFDDAVRAGILEPDDLPASVRDGRRRPTVGADRGVHGRGARRHRPDRRGRDDRAGGVGAGRVPGVQLRAHLPAAGGATTGRRA